MFTVEIKVPEAPKVVFFTRLPEKSEDGRWFENVTRRVAKLEIVPVKEDADAHYLRRLDAEGAQVWQTSHPSLDETFWQAEWEYGTSESAWKKA